MEWLDKAWAIIQHGGPAMIFVLGVLCVILYQERNAAIEKLEAEIKRNREREAETQERVMTGLHNATDAIKELTGLFYRGAEKRDR